MKLIIAGGRDMRPSFEFIVNAIKMLGISDISEIVSGGANGVDNEGEHFASHMKLPLKQFPADWNKHGRAAGPIRNAEMAEYADALLLIWDGESKGSGSTKREMMRKKKPIYEVVLKRS